MANRTCTIPDCNRAHYALGLCSAHYRRQHRTGHTGSTTATTSRLPCAVDGCDLESSARGYCASHYARWKRTGTVSSSPIALKRDTTIRDEHGRKQCRSCDTWLPVDQYGKNAKNADGLHSYCANCDHDIIITRRYGVPRGWYRTTLAAQNGVCAVCQQPPANARKMHVDHAHTHCRTGCADCVRGILCSRCNTGIGMFMEDTERLNAAITYLRDRRR